MVNEQEITNVVKSLESKYGKQKITIAHIGGDYYSIHVDAPNKSAYVSLVFAGDKSYIESIFADEDKTSEIPQLIMDDYLKMGEEIITKLGGSLDLNNYHNIFCKKLAKLD